MGNVKNGDRLVCVPCGREVLVDSCGLSERTLVCCGKTMKPKTKTTHKKKT